MATMEATVRRSVETVYRRTLSVIKLPVYVVVGVIKDPLVAFVKMVRIHQSTFLLTPNTKQHTTIINEL